MENCESFRGFDFIYIYIYIYIDKNITTCSSCSSQIKPSNQELKPRFQEHKPNNQELKAKSQEHK